MGEGAKIEVLAEERTVEFIRREYAARRIYLENKEDYKSIEAAIAALRSGGEYLASLRGGAACGDAVQCELEALKLVEDGRFAALPDDQLSAFIDGCGGGVGLVDGLKLAHFYSVKYGYVISDVGMNCFDIPRRFSLLLAMHRESEVRKRRLKKSLSKLDIPGGMSLTFKFKHTDVRYYGDKVSPWHCVKRNGLSGEDFYYEDFLEMFPDYTATVSGISKIDFSFEAAISKIAIDICEERMRYVLFRKIKLSDDFYHLAVELLGGHHEALTKYSFEKISEYADCINENSYVDKLAIEKKDYEVMELLGDKNSRVYKKIIKCNAELTAEMERLKKHLNGSEKKLFSGRYRLSTKDTPRYVGLYLWDLIEIEGMRFGEAVEKFRVDYEGLFGCTYTSDSSNPYHRLYSVTDDCIREQVFLPMKSSTCFYDRRDMRQVKRGGTQRGGRG